MNMVDLDSTLSELLEKTSNGTAFNMAVTTNEFGHPNGIILSSTNPTVAADLFQIIWDRVGHWESLGLKNSAPPESP